jgi:hypothetical protein
VENEYLRMNVTLANPYAVPITVPSLRLRHVCLCTMAHVCVSVRTSGKMCVRE